MIRAVEELLMELCEDVAIRRDGHVREVPLEGVPLNKVLIRRNPFREISNADHH